MGCTRGNADVGVNSVLVYLSALSNIYISILETTDRRYQMDLTLIKQTSRLESILSGLFVYLRFTEFTDGMLLLAR
jgi:hypothetical protein